MISEMLKIRDGRIRQILARSSILVRNALRSKRPGFPRLRPLRKLEDLALDVINRMAGPRMKRTDACDIDRSSRETENERERVSQVVRSYARARGGTHRHLPSSEGEAGKRKEGRLELRGEER